MQQTIQVWGENKPGAVMRVAGIVTAKGCNIELLSVAADPWQPGVSRMILVVETEPRLHVRIVNEMNRLINVLLALDVSQQSRGRGAAERLPLHLVEEAGPAC